LIENTEEFFNLRPDTDLKSLNPDIFGTPLK